MFCFSAWASATHLSNNNSVCVSFRVYEIPWACNSVCMWFRVYEIPCACNSLKTDRHRFIKIPAIELVPTNRGSSSGKSFFSNGARLRMGILLRTGVRFRTNVCLRTGLASPIMITSYSSNRGITNYITSAHHYCNAVCSSPFAFHTWRERWSAMRVRGRGRRFKRPNSPFFTSVVQAAPEFNSRGSAAN